MNTPVDDNSLPDLQRLLADLALERPVFHSEADFQHAVAWELHRRIPGAQVRLELPISLKTSTIHLDIWVGQGAAGMAVELKYKTRGLKTVVDGESFHLRDQSAQDLGRYDFIKDIQRSEHVAAARPGTAGFAILLTNDSSYWASLIRPNLAYAAFSLAEDRLLHGAMKWGSSASAGTTKGREETLDLAGAYVLHWQDYSKVTATGYGRFRTLTVRV